MTRRLLLTALLLTTGALAQKVDVPTPAAAAPGADPVLDRGRYLAAAGDCVSCHTGPSKQPFAGGLPLATPFGTIVSSNITPDASSGIGAYSEADFARALREGVRRDGQHLYPAMPYPSYTKLADDDIHALYVFFKTGVKPSALQPPKTNLPWPFSMRGLMVGWNWLYLKPQRYQPVADRQPEWNRGAYLVQGLGHCGDCHTPRSLAGGVKAASDSDGSNYLAGALIDGWYAQPLRHGTQPNAAQWTQAQIVAYLQTGRTAHSGAFGPMAQVVQNSTQYLSEGDLRAIAVYLQSLGAAQAATEGQSPQTAVVAAAASQPAALHLRAGTPQGAGAMVYLNNCNACHRSSGSGAERVFPALAGNSVVTARDPTSLIRIVLAGSAMPSTRTAPAALGMPAFGWRLSDDNVAQLLSFARNSWGNDAGSVSAAQVAKVRKTLPEPVVQQQTRLETRR